MFESRFQSFNDSATPKESTPRVAALRNLMADLKLDGFIVPHADEHQSEYMPSCDERLSFISGFTGSAGCAIILKKTAVIFSDGRYTLQIQKQVDTKLFTPVPSHETPVHTWMETGLPRGAKIGYDARLHTSAELERYTQACTKIAVKLVAVETNLVDLIWTDRPSAPCGMITIQPEALAGKLAKDKIKQVQEQLRIQKLDALLVSDPHNIAWLFNIRGSDVSHTPIALCYALIPLIGSPTLFINPEKISDFIRPALSLLTEIASPDEITLALRQTAHGKRKIRLDTTTSGSHFKELLERSGGIADMGADPITAIKAIKNETEISGSRAAHIRDGAALVQFLAWLDKTTQNSIVTEIDAVKALEHFRRETGKLKDISFSTISGFGANGAIVHYRVSEESNLTLKKGLFLIDSGGQYEDGTTDVTRTISIGKPTAEMKDRFTRVLKGMIALSCTSFPKGTTGAQLDVLARQFLWEKGLDYDHGTGHGVGSYLSVHEGPQAISKKNTTQLEPGMILSNEPGYYKAKRYGIRIENLILVELRSIKGGDRDTYGFETLTLAPIDRSLIAKSLLSKTERNWINSYHTRVYETFWQLVPQDTAIWLKTACQPI